MAKTYKTISGDVWDVIAAKVYGKESYMSFLMENNQEYLDYFVFPEGIVLRIKEVTEQKSILPDWRL